jgi:hypothetical protein
MKQVLQILSLIFFIGVHFSAHAASFPLTASYTIENAWPTGYQVTVTLTNPKNTPTNTWTATFTLPQGHSISTLWNGVYASSGQAITVNNPKWIGGGTISAGGQTTFGMIVNMPSNQAGPALSNLQAAADGTPQPPPPPSIPQSPILNPITFDSGSSNSYIVSWNSVANANAYLLQQDTSSNFSNPKTTTQGNVLSYHFTNQSAGSYFYRVLASNASGNSPYSNVESIDVTQTPPPPPPPTGGVEHSVWYIDWTSWFNGPPFVLPSGVNVINIFVGELRFGTDGKPTLGGFGNMTLPQIDAFTAYCKAQNPPIAVKVSIGGSGGMYDRCWDLLTSQNIQAFAQGMVDFCHAHGLAGVDFDYEAFVSADQEALVGALIKAFKILDPNLQTSLCTNAGFGPNFPWQQAVKNILDAAMIAPNHCAVDKVYIMSYYNSQQDEEDWIVGPDGNGGWANWLQTNYGFSRDRIAVGIDDFDAHAYDPAAFAAWAVSQGFGTAHWAFDPARP